jgi:hypothetical protein
VKDEPQMAGDELCRGVCIASLEPEKKIQLFAPRQTRLSQDQSQKAFRRRCFHTKISGTMLGQFCGGV